MSNSVQTLVSSITNPVTAISNAMGSMFGIGSGGNSSIFEKLSSAFVSKSQSDKSDNSIADAGKAMYYDDAITAITTSSVIGGMVDAIMQTPVGQAVGGIIRDSRGLASTNLMDYSDSMRGSVSPMSAAMIDSEGRVAQEKYGSMPSSGVIPGMDGIESYLAEENNMTKMVIELLEAIKYNTSGKSQNTVVGPRSNGVPANGGMKMRRVSQEQSAGEWDITFGDYSPSSNTKQ